MRQEIVCRHHSLPEDDGKSLFLVNAIHDTHSSVPSQRVTEDKLPPSRSDRRVPDDPRTEPGVRFSRTGLFSPTRFRIPVQAIAVALLVCGCPTIRGRPTLKCSVGRSK